MIVDAQLTLTNIDTGVANTAPSNAEGIFRFSSLGPGRYKLVISKPGFASIEQENIALGGEETRTLSVTLKPGAPSDTVTITAEVNPIQLSESKDRLRYFRSRN